MKAIQFKKFGSPAVLEFVEIPVPILAENEYLKRCCSSASCVEAETYAK